MKKIATILTAGVLLSMNSRVHSQTEIVSYEPIPLPSLSPLVDSSMTENAVMIFNSANNQFKVSNNASDQSEITHLEPSHFTRNSLELMNDSRQFSNLVAADQIGVLTDYPIRTVVKLNITMYNPSSGQTSYGGCSGIMIGDNEVLTAGHCVDKGGNDPSYATAISVVPAYNMSSSPFGSVQMSQWVSFTQWTDNGNWNYDIAMLKLDQPIGNTVGWLGFGYVMNDAFFTSSSNTFHSFGYPAQNDAGQTVYEGGERMYYMNGFMDYFESANSMSHYNMGFHGQSGSGLYYNDNGNRYVYGVLSHGSNQIPNTCHTRIDEWMFNQFLSQYDTGSSSLNENAVTSSVSVAPNPSLSGQFYVRFNDINIEQLSVFNSSGELIKTIENQNAHEIVVDLSEFSDGVYHCTAISQGQVIRERMIKM